MAYNQYNHLQIVKAVLETFNEHKQEGVTTAYVYRKYIFPKFFISRATFYNYMNIPVNKRIKEIEEKRKNAKQQCLQFAAVC